MTAIQFGNVAMSLLAIVAIWVLYSVAYRDYRQEVFRQKLFDLRQELFDLARSDAISFDHPAYGTLRTTLNGFIRFAHHVEFAPLVLYLIADARNPKQTGQSFIQAFESQASMLDVDVRAQLYSLVVRMHLYAAEQLILTSPSLLLSVIPFFVLIAAKHASEVWAKHIYQFCRGLLNQRWIDAIDSAAMREGALTA